MDITNVPCGYLGGYTLKTLTVGNQYFSFGDIAREGDGSVSSFIEIPAGVQKFYFKPVKRQRYEFQYNRDSGGHIIYNPDGTPSGHYDLISETSLCFNRINYFQYLGENSGYKYLGYDIGGDTEDPTTLERQAQSYRWQATHVVFNCSVKYTQVPFAWAGSVSITVIQSPDFYTIHEPWLISENDELYSEPIPEIREKSIEIPMPKALWRINPLMNGGFPWHELLPDIMGVDIEPLPIERKIKVYSMWEPQNGFQHNGLAILDPISCTSHEEENSRYDVTLVHPLDDWGKWKYLIPQNILKVNGQLFRIDIQQPKINSSERTVTVTANHIFYDLSRDIILLKTIPEPQNQNWTPLLLLNWIMHSGVIATERQEHPEAYTQFNIYDFTYSTDISSDKKNQFDGFTNTTLTAALIGESNCFVNLFGGELYRNNFYFSINSRRENARDNAFSFRYSFDLTEIEFSIDYTNFATRMDFIDMYGNFGFTWLWNYGTVGYATPSPIVRAVKFNVPISPENTHDCFDKTAYPKYSYKINLAQIKDDPKYRDFQNLHDVKVGDKGMIFCEPLGVETEQKVIALDRDELSLEILSVTLGDSTKYLGRSNPYQGITTSGNSPTDLQSQALQEEIRKTNLKNMKHWNGASSYSWGEISTFKWGEIYE